MTTHVPRLHHETLRVSEWVLGILAAIAAVMGVAIMVLPDDEYVGLGGQQFSWRVGDLSPWWGYGLLAGGVVLGIVSVLLVRRDHQDLTPAEEQHSGMADLAVHATAFVGVNAFLWAQDLALGDGLNYAYWATIPWAVGLAFHAYAVFAERRRERLGTG